MLLKPNPGLAPQPLDVLLVLGRGIESDGTLTRTGFDRAEDAVHVARAVGTKAVVFSGGRSWVQTLAGITPPSEGGAMLAHAVNCMGVVADELLQASGVRYVAEEDSTSTVDNLVKSKQLLESQQLGLPERGARIGIVSDWLHFEENRVQHLAGLVFPDVELVLFPIARTVTPEERREEKLTAFMTSIAMLGVRAGNDRAIMRRQRFLEKGNAVFRRAVGLLQTRH